MKNGVRRDVVRARRGSRVDVVSPRGRLEALEGRTLLSVIAWTNRGTTDNFGVYGANAGVARGIVDRAIADWQKVITSFNFTGAPNGSNYYAITISAKNLGSNGERGEASATNVDNAKRPTAGYVNVDDDGGGFGWYFDPAINTASGQPDDGEFTNLKTPFAGSIPVSSGSDFYRTVTHEIGHALGLSLTAGLRMRDLFGTQTPTLDPADTSQYLWTINWDGGAPDATFTANGGGHLFEGPSPAGTSYPTFPDDLMNAGRTVPYSPTLRELISDSDASILANVYGYSIRLPSTLHTLCASLNGSVLKINGTAGDDLINLNYNGASLDVSVNGNQESFATSGFSSVEIRSGNGVDQVHLSDASDPNIATYTVDGTTFNTPGQSPVSFVDGNVLDTMYFMTGANTSNVYVRSLAGFALNVNTRGGDDNLFLGNTAGAMASFAGSITFAGDTGNDHVWVTDTGRTATQTYTLTHSTLGTADPTGGFTLIYDDGVEGVHLYGPDVASTYNVLWTGAPTTLNGGNGDDTFNFGSTGSLSGMTDTLTVNAGAGGADHVVFDDSANTTGSFYPMTAHAFSRSGLAVINFDAEIVELHTGSGNDQIAIGDTAAGSLTSVFGGAGNDQLVVGYVSFLAPSLLDAVNGSIYFDGQGGTADEVDLEDLNETVGRSFTLNASTLAASHMASVTIANAEQVGLDAGGGADTITVRPSTAVSFRVNGAANAGGSDRLIVSAIGSNVPTQQATSSTSGTFTLAGYKDVAYSAVETFGAVFPTVTAGGTVQGQFPFAYTFTFSDDVSASLNAGDVTITNLATGQAYVPGSVTWDAASKTATFRLSSVPADGNYRVRLLASGITSGAGPLQTDYTFDTFYLAGDANFDRKVDFADLLTLAKHYGTTGRTFAEGNFDYSADGSVNFSDLLMLARNYGKSLLAPQAAIQQPAAAMSRKRPSEMIIA